MTEILQSSGTLNSGVDDSSTPSNNSQYFSVTSSLDILNGSSDLYYSMEEGLENGFRTNNLMESGDYECDRIIIVNLNDFEDDMHNLLEHDEESESDIFIQVGLKKQEDGEKNYDNSNSRMSQESISSDEDGTNNYSALTDSVINSFPIEKHDSDEEENASLSIHNVTQMTNSVIEGEFSEINDIVYESSLSQEPFVNDDESETRDQSSLDGDIEQKTIDTTFLMTENEKSMTCHNMSILELVRKIEFSELDSKPTEIEVIKVDDISMKEDTRSNKEHSETSQKDIKFHRTLSKKTVDENDKIVSSKTTPKKEVSKSKPSKAIEESPNKRSSFCCSIKRRKPKISSSNQTDQATKSKSLFSFFKFYKKDRSQLKSPKSLPELNATNCILLAQDGDECQGIPFIDADVGFYTDAYIPLAKHELYCD